MDFAKAVARIFDHLENDKVEAAAMACLRVARVAQDHMNAAIFLRELSPKNKDVARTIYDDAPHLTDEAKKFIYERSADRWLELHDVGFPVASSGADDDRTVLMIAAGEIEPELAEWQGTLSDITPPSGLTPLDTAAFHDVANSKRESVRLRVRAINMIKARLKARCLNYAIQIEKQLAAQDRNQAFLWTVENDVNNYFKARDLDLFYMLQKASALAASKEPEDAALLLTEVRRALKTAADHFYPPRAEPVICSDGNERVLGDAQYLNRLSEYLGGHIPSSTAREMVAAELAFLDSFTRRLNDLASKGVHTKVTQVEARQGLVGMYMFLSTIIQPTPTV